MTPGRRGPKTADELLSELERDPAYLMRIQLDDERQRRAQERYEQAAEGLLRDLAVAGFHVSSVAELRQRGVGRREATPILIRWLPKISYAPLKQDVATALGSTWARPHAARALVDEFRRVDPATDDRLDSIRVSLADSLERVADESVLEDVIEIAMDRRHGLHRAFVVAALGKMRKHADVVFPLLAQLLEDEQVAGYAILGLGNLKDRRARPLIEPFLTHEKPFLRREAKKAMAKLS